MTADHGARPVEPRRGAAADHTLLLDRQFEERDLVALRQAVAAYADRTTLPATQVADLMVIASELATNAVRHGGGRGRLRLWTAAGAIHCQVTDNGPGLPEAHRSRPPRPRPGAVGGRGLWLVLQFSDKLDLGTTGQGATVTATLALPAAVPSQRRRHPWAV